MTPSNTKGPANNPLLSQSFQAAIISSQGDTGDRLENHPRTTGAVQSIESHKAHPNDTSDKATAAFVRRTLCSQSVLLRNGERGRTIPQSIDEVLPPLTSSNAVDLQLYGIISVIIKEFVQTWYTKFTPDQVFVDEILQIIAHCTRALEQRFRQADLESLLLDEIPDRLEAHVRSYRLAKRQANSPHSLMPDPRVIYHIHHPHPALSPVPTESVPSTIIEQRENESAWRQLLIQGILAVLLPTEDLENGCLRALVAEIFAEMILGNGVGGKACEGWLLWEGITSITKALQKDGAKEQLQSSKANPEQSKTRLERFGLLPQANGAQPTSKHGHADRRRNVQPVFGALMDLIWSFIQCAFLAWVAMRSAFKILATSSSLSLRSYNVEPRSGNQNHQSYDTLVDGELSRRPLGFKRPIVSMKLWSCVVQLTELDMRMPWLSGSISMLRWGLLIGPGRVGGTDRILDRFISHAIHERILNPAFLPFVLRTIRATIFPNNALGPTRQPPTAEETRAIKRRCAASLLELLRPKVASTFFATQEHGTQLEEIEETLSCLEDAYLNKHFIFQIVELIVLRLVPELGERGVRVMIEERLG